MIRKPILLALLLGLLIAAPATASGVKKPQPGTTVMHIVIPKLHLNMKVVQGPPPGNEDGYYPTHYAWSDLAGQGGTVAISAHHYTHALPGALGGPFRFINTLHPGDVIFLQTLKRFGGRTVRYVVSGQRTFQCGNDPWTCLAAGRGFRLLQQNKLILTTCIGNGDERRFLYAYAQKRK